MGNADLKHVPFKRHFDFEYLDLYAEESSVELLLVRLVKSGASFFVLHSLMDIRLIPGLFRIF